MCVRPHFQSPTYFCAFMTEQKYNLATKRWVWEAVACISSLWLYLTLQTWSDSAAKDPDFLVHIICHSCKQLSVYYLLNVIYPGVKWWPRIHPLPSSVGSALPPKYILSLSTSLHLYCHHLRPCHYRAPHPGQHCKHPPVSLPLLPTGSPFSAQQPEYSSKEIQIAVLSSLSIE